jgi:hypothetical protein
MNELELIQKQSVLQCVYQIIASADGELNEKRDLKAIDYAMEQIGIDDDAIWSKALSLNCYDAFTHLSQIPAEDKKSLKTTLLKIANMGGDTLTRRTCAEHICHLVGCE